jgi:Na+-translocating ferredoxin:NAD+ oxidoreductase RnfG subunit
MQSDSLHYLRRYSLALVIFLIIGLIVVASRTSQSQILQNRKGLDRNALAHVLPVNNYDNDLLADAVRLSGDVTKGEWVRLDLLGLRHDRLAYLTKSKGELTMVIIPATAQDGLNGEVDLLVAIDMFGRI